ncbi:hypothetical protein [Micrococcus lylae]|uniref:hypothetical protein n=1 Tax=Micrococcus lylae TaxID=1273 RepID=UPI0008305ADF|nr:hypothetical protein [Micrococcus lylae]
MTTIHDDLGMEPVPATWWEPTPGTHAWRIRAAVRWTLAMASGATTVAALMWIDLVGSTLTP